MKKLFTLLFLVSLSALAGDYRSFTEDQTATGRAAPTLTTDGMSMDDVTAFRVSVCAESSRTLSGAGRIDFYLFNPTTGLWMLNKDLYLPISVGATSCAGSACRCQQFPDQIAAAVLGARMLPAANGVTISGGTTVTVRVDAEVKPVRR